VIDVPRSNWRRVRFGDVVEHVTETVKDPVAAGLDRVVALENMVPGSLCLGGWQDASEGTTFTRRFRTGQTLFAKRRAYQRKVAYAEFDGVCSGDILALQAKSGELVPDLLPFIVQSDAFFEHALRTSAGSLSPRTKWQDLATWEFDLPPLDQQERVASLLWGVERYRRAATREMDATSELVAAVADSCLAEYPPSRLLDMADVVTGPPYPSASYCSPYEGVRLLRGANIGVGHTRWEQSDTVYWPKAREVRDEYVLRPGDLVVAMDRPFTADGRLRAAVIGREDDGCFLNQRVTRVRVKKGLDPRLMTCLRASSVFGRALSGSQTGSFAPHISVRDIAEFGLGAIGGDEPDLDRLSRAEATHVSGLEALSKSAVLADVLSRQLSGVRP